MKVFPTSGILVRRLLSIKIKRVTNSYQEEKMKNRFGISDQALEKRGFTSSLDEGVIDVTDLISNRRFQGISETVFHIIEKGSARLEIKESQVKLIFKTLQEKKAWEENYLSHLTQSDPVYATP
jgi:hypothetical protein